MSAGTTSSDGIAAARERASALGISNLITVGAVAGLVAGFAFVLANMAYANSKGMPTVAPFADIGTVFLFADEPKMNSEFLITGLVTHFALSIGFGILFALLVPLFSRLPTLVVGALVYGLVLYVVNFQILGRILFDWFSPENPNGPNQVFELIIHPAIFGLLLVPFFAGMVTRREPTTSERRAATGAASPAASKPEPATR